MKEVVLSIVKCKITNSGITFLSIFIPEQFFLQQNSNLCFNSDSAECTDWKMIQDVNSEIKIILGAILKSLEKCKGYIWPTAAFILYNGILWQNWVWNHQLKCLASLKNK